MDKIIEDTQKIIFDLFSCDLEYMKSSVRKNAFKYSYERIIFCYNCMKKGVSCITLSQVLNRHYSTILYLRGKYHDLYQYNSIFREKADLVDKYMQNIKHLTEENLAVQFSSGEINIFGLIGIIKEFNFSKHKVELLIKALDLEAAMKPIEDERKPIYHAIDELREHFDIPDPLAKVSLNDCLNMQAIENIKKMLNWEDERKAIYD